jgi:hypothetical protein
MQTNLDEEKYAEVTVNLDGCEPVTFNIQKSKMAPNTINVEIDGDLTQNKPALRLHLNDNRIFDSPKDGTKSITPDERGEVFSNSEAYAAERMPQLRALGAVLTRVELEIVHDALMAAFQAGYLNRAEGLSVDALIARMA